MSSSISFREPEPPVLPTTAGKRKRTASFKHRSSRACQSCRTRKVRCDVAANLSRCTNCRLDGIECVVIPSRRGRNKQEERYHANTSPQLAQVMMDYSSGVAGIDEASRPTMSQLGADVARNDSGTGISTPIVPSGPGYVPVCVTFEQDIDNVGSDHQPPAESTPNERSEGFNGPLTPDTATDALGQHQNQTETIPLPACIAPLSSHVLSEDREYLVRKGALIVPERDVQVEILRGYIFSVHPFMPMLDRSFVDAVLNSREDAKVSLLLFQAVMFAGLHSLPLHVIHRLKFKSTKQARAVFFDRVRLLYEFDIEPDAAAVLQSLILMSSWCGARDYRKRTWHWTGLAYDVARSMGLHRESRTKRASDPVRRFRRRLWWSLYIRDRMIALGTRRPIRIRDECFDVAMLTLEDFDLEEVDFQGQHLHIPSVEESTDLAHMCVQLAKLCVCIGHVMSSQYTTLSTQHDIPHTMMVVPRRDEWRAKELERCDRELNEWFQLLPTHIQRHDPTNGHSCLEVHWQILNLTYLSSVNVLHRVEALQPLSESIEARRAQNTSRLKVKDAARRMTRLLHTMLQQDQVRFLGLIGVTALVAACLSHMLDISSGSDADVCDASAFRLYQSLEVLQFVRGIYASADAAISFLASVSRKAGIAIPVHFAIAPTTGLEFTSTEGISKSFQVLQEQPHKPLESSSGVVSTVSPSEVAFASSYSARPSLLRDKYPLTEQSNPQFVDMNFGVVANSASDAELLNLNNDGMDASLGLEPMAFNYDFYSDAFGFFACDFHEPQQA